MEGFLIGENITLIKKYMEQNTIKLSKDSNLH